MHAHRELGSLGRAVAQTHSGNHVALACCSHTGATALERLVADFVPQVGLGGLDFGSLGV